MKKLIAVACAAVSAAVLAETPESQGVSSRAILSWIDACEKELDAVHGFVLRRHGKVIAEGSWAPYDTLNRTHMLYSHSKSFTSTAVGFLVDEGKVDLDERVLALFPDKAPANPSENLRQLRVRDLLTMNVGAKHTDAERDDANGDWEKAFLANLIDDPPGTKFRYDSGATYMLSAIVERKSGLKTMDFLKQRLFGPIGIEKAWSTTSPSGTACGGWGMNMTTRELAKFGQLCLNGGVWEGKRLLSSEWIALATSRQTWSGAIGVANEDGSDWHQGYGFQFWRCCPEGAYRADGANGQLTVVMTRQDAVLSVHAGLGNMQQELSLVWKHLLPAMASEPLAEDPQAVAALQAKCKSLTLRTVAGVRDGAEPFVGRTFETGEKRVKALTLADAPEGWSLAVETAAGQYRLPIGFGQWRAGEIAVDAEPHEPLGRFSGAKPLAVAASGAVLPNGTFRVDAWFTDGPHRLQLDFVQTNGVAKASGRIFGLGGCPIKGVAK